MRRLMRVVNEGVTRPSDNWQTVLVAAKSEISTGHPIAKAFQPAPRG